MGVDLDQNWSIRQCFEAARSHFFHTAGDSRGISDKFEAVRPYTLNISGEISPERQRKLKQILGPEMGIPESQLGNGGFEFHGTSLVRFQPDALVLCASTNLDDKTIDRMRADSEKSGGQPYDYAIPIKRPAHFANAIMRSLYYGRVVQVPEVNCYIGKVDYIDAFCDTSSEFLPEGSLFEKDKFFESQSEHRFIFDNGRVPIDRNGVCVSPEVDEDFFGSPIQL